MELSLADLRDIESSAAKITVEGARYPEAIEKMTVAREMKVSLFEQVPYRYMPEGFENQHNSVVTAPYQVVEPARMTESLFSAYAELMGGARAGFDGAAAGVAGGSGGGRVWGAARRGGAWQRVPQGRLDAVTVRKDGSEEREMASPVRSHDRGDH